MISGIDYLNVKKKFLACLMFPVVLPILDIGMGSAIISMFALFSLFLCILLTKKPTLPKFAFLILLGWLLLSIFSVIFVVISNSLEFGSLYILDSHYLYVLRFISVFFIFFSATYFLSENSKQANLLSILRFYSVFLFILIMASFLFELTLRLFDLKSLLYLYKARQDLGGIDTVHYNRFSGFWSYPGDAAAVTVLSFVLIYLYELKYRFVKLVFLFIILLLTQSKAGLALLLSFFIIHSLMQLSLRSIVNLCTFSLISALFIIYLDLDYFLRFFENLEFYVSESKRATEVLNFLGAPFIEMLFGLTELQNSYESELFGSFSRTGILGSFWLLSIVAFLLLNLVKFSAYRYIIILLLLFIVVYCLISAGMSRTKVLIPFSFLFGLVVVNYTKPHNGALSK